MNLKKLVAVSKLSGVFRMAANRSNGLIVEHLDTGKKRFVSSRQHQFTPLETISIYTDDEETAELKRVFGIMKEQQAENPPFPNSASSEEARKYFEKILPNYDRDRVFVSDIKKIVKWFNYLNERNMLEDTEEEPETTASEETKEEAEVKE